MKRSNETILKNRISQVADLLLNGYCTRAEVLQFAAKNKWNVSDRQVDTYIAKAKKEIEKSVEQKTEFNRAKAERILGKVIRKAFENDDLRSIISATKEMATLQGLYKSETEHTGTITFISDIKKLHNGNTSKI